MKSKLILWGKKKINKLTPAGMTEEKERIQMTTIRNERWALYDELRCSTYHLFTLLWRQYSHPVYMGVAGHDTMTLAR